MKFNLILEDMELIKDNFEKFTSPLEDIDKKIRNKTQQNFQLGLVINKKDENDIKLGLNYKIEISQRVLENDEELSNASVEYIFVFKDVDNNTVNSVKNEELTEDEFGELVTYLNELVYPYIKEYLEGKYKKANILLKLPLNLKEER
ncbi:hypothetical protein P5E62_07155 [Clostridium perfringens]|uniref:hypothetical protein n=1 Tax=Clostridium perfringens TaxID=1502 RepID=UPI001CB29EE3|nr:hypothetical protein [Clostridium perfringens]MDK0709344.1 hypothetical protein [Clostridium perfringens]MDK0711947.1 hypothetical protein [Clostridium perfringens]MDM0630696.1 hypothetical protein [Clostridium perfringens]MDM0642625.1 hypothetical protein [Clostridium perfringens]